MIPCLCPKLWIKYQNRLVALVLVGNQSRLSKNLNSYLWNKKNIPISFPITVMTKQSLQILNKKEPVESHISLCSEVNSKCRFMLNRFGMFSKIIPKR